MDPNATLTSIRNKLELMARWTPKDRVWRTAAGFLAEEVAALDEWLGRGGFLPTDWSGATATDRDLGAELPDWTDEDDAKIQAELKENDNETCPHGLSASLCVDPINHYPPDTPGQPGYGWH